MHWIDKAQPQNLFAAGIDELPSMPQTLLEVLDACQKPNVDFAHLAQIVRQDPVLLLKALTIASSTRTLSNAQLENLDQVLIFLGIGTIRTIAVTSTINYYFSRPDEQTSRAQKKYWQDALRCALVCQELAETISYPYPQEAYNAGLLHSIGELALLTGNPKEYADTYLSVSSDRELNLFEEEWFGANSCMMGAEELEELIEDSFISDALRYQQQSASAVMDTPTLVQLLNLALTSKNEQLSVSTSNEEPIALGIPAKQFNAIKEQAEQQLIQLNQSLGIQHSNDLTPNINDMAVKNKLGAHIKGFATMYGLNQRQPTDKLQTDAWHGVLTNLNILFGFTRSIAFEYHHDSNTLTGIAGNSTDMVKLKQLNLQVSNGRSLAADSLLNGSPVYSETLEGKNAHSLADQQLQRFLGNEGFACIPILENGYRFGVIVVGAKRQQLISLSQQHLLIDQFSKAAASNLAEQQESALIFQQTLDTQRSQQLNGIRKLAHEAANPLGVIKNYVQVLSRSLADNNEAEEQLQLIQQEIDRVASLIDNMHDIDKGVNFCDGLININQLIEDQVEIFRNSAFATNSISCRLDLDKQLPMLKTHAPSIKQIFTNLLRNSVEAMPNGGRVTLTSRSNINFNGKIYVVLTIADTGTGITDKMIGKAFTPLNSSKGKDHSGLGLSVVSNLVTKLDGHISCRNGNDGGAEFTILLPC